jgi:hypothetical protein
MKSLGKLVYSPRTHLASSERWLVLMCDDEISRYYRHLFSVEYPYLNSDRHGKLTRPVWGTHISVIRGEKIPNFNLWRLDENKLIEFEYDGGVQDNGEYYWLKATCPYLSDLRIKYGLTKEPRFGFHLTIGRTTQ